MPSRIFPSICKNKASGLDLRIVRSSRDGGQSIDYALLGSDSVRAMPIRRRRALYTVKLRSEKPVSHRETCHTARTRETCFFAVAADAE